MLLVLRTQLYSQCEQLLNVEEASAGGVFRPDVPDPEMSYAGSTALWELSLFKVSMYIITTYNCNVGWHIPKYLQSLYV